MAIGIALLGAGIFAKREHLPAIQACQSLDLKAVYSRSQKSVEEFVAQAGNGIDVYFDSPYAEEKALEKLLRREDIKAVIVAVAIPVAPTIIKKALAAGKHILSEKPIAPDVESALNLIHYQQQEAKSAHWAVGENFRYWKAIHRVAQILKDLNAKLQTFSISCYNFTNDKNPFFHSDWRQNPTFQGGWILDGGVHFVAVLRILLAALGCRIKTVSAFTTQLQENLSPVDTVHAILKTDDGSVGSFVTSVGIESKLGMEFEIVTNKGSVVYRPFQMHIVTKVKNQDGKWEEHTEATPLMWGVKEEVAAFAHGIATGDLDSRLSTAEALEDLKVLEAMLKSGNEGGASIEIVL